ncbi:phage tail tube protein [Sphingobium sp. RAC03]|uniref:phage tail tube protein n=1 Tax=Sphingobium sp. RAC03 TaxID=1843368 RepID=UPI00083E157C|nr:phage tail tube protein [Sphingobium sp. RAC03]AOF95553.1 hypothetical protein BSY17_2643 [Sphingobium sp. RAC03]
MGYGMGINTVMYAIPEVTYGVTPATGFNKLSYISHTLGEESPLIEDDQLGLGREGHDPTYDVKTNDGDIVVPLDMEAIGFWLRGLLGAPVNGGTAGAYSHVFESGKSVLPSHSIEIGHPDVPAFSVHYGAVVNQMRIGMARSGLLNATVSLIAKGETATVNASVAGGLVLVSGDRFAQASGVIKRDGVALGNVVSADITISNGLDKIETISPDGRISGVIPGIVQAQINIRTRFNSLDLLAAATDGTPVELDEIGWSKGPHSLKFSMPRVFLPKVKRPVDGPRGVMQDFNCQASGRVAPKVTATLTNNTEFY